MEYGSSPVEHAELHTLNRYGLSPLAARSRMWAARGERPYRFRVWSSACSTGEEPYSISMALYDGLPPTDGWQLEVIATEPVDQGTREGKERRLPNRARRRSAAAVPQGIHVCRRVRDHKQAKMKIAPEIRDIITFQRMNLMDEAYAVQGVFDIILLSERADLLRCPHEGKGGGQTVSIT